MRIKISAIAVLFFLAVLVPAIMADSDAPKDNAVTSPNVQKIAFASKRNGNFDICTINDDGTDLKRLTSSKDDDLKPQWSHDGQKILYLSKEGRKYALRVMNSDGSSQLKIFNDCSIEYPPAWSPDGSKILFTVKSGSKNAIFTVDASGGTPTRLTELNSDGACPSWSPDGSKVLFRQRYKDDIYLFTINPDGTGRLKLTRDPGRYVTLVWSPDGSQVGYIGISRKFFSMYNKIYTIKADGTNNLEIVNASKKMDDIDYLDELSWSPDGATLVYNRVERADVYETEKGSVTFVYYYGIYLITSDGNGHEEMVARTGENRVLPAWAPDSSKLAYLNNSKLTILDMKSKLDNVIRVNVSIPLSPVKWSADGTKILFAGKNSSFQKAGLYIVTLDGKVTKLTEGNDYDPVWAPVVNQ